MLGPLRRRRALSATSLPFTLLAWGEQHITSALTAVLNASTPLFTAAVRGGRCCGERLRPIAGGRAWSSASSAWRVAAGIGGGRPHRLVAGRRGRRRGRRRLLRPRFVYMRAQPDGRPADGRGRRPAQPWATILLAPVAVATIAGRAASTLDARPGSGSVLLLGVLGTGLAYVLNYRVIADLGADHGLAGHLHHPGRRGRGRHRRARRAVRVADRGRRRAHHRWRVPGQQLGRRAATGCGGGRRPRWSWGCWPGCGGGVAAADPGRAAATRSAPSRSTARTWCTCCPAATTRVPHRPAHVGAAPAHPAGRGRGHQAAVPPGPGRPARGGQGAAPARGPVGGRRGSARRLAGDEVVVAPNPDLPDDDAVVATAWVTKQTSATFSTAPPCRRSPRTTPTRAPAATDDRTRLLLCRV